MLRVRETLLFSFREMLLLLYWLTMVDACPHVASKYKDWCGFKFPLFIAGTHMVFSWVATAMSLHLGSASNFMPMAERMEKVLPFTLFHAASLACANFALTYMYPSYHVLWQRPSLECHMFNMLNGYMLQITRVRMP